MVKAYIPKDFEEAKKILKEKNAKVLSGGTDLMVQRRRHPGVTPNITRPVVFVGHLKELSFIETEPHEIRVGAAAKLSAILENPVIPEALKWAVREIGAPGIRNMATLAGNIANASPAADTLPFLYCSNAEVVLDHIDGSRIMKIEEFVLGPGLTALGEGELIREIVFYPPKHNKVFYKKVGTRRANALSKLSFLGYALLDKSRIADIRIAFGAVAPTVVRSRQIEESLVGTEADGITAAVLSNSDDSQSSLCQSIMGYGSLLSPIDDQRSSAVYRKQTALDLYRHFLINLNNQESI